MEMNYSAVEIPTCDCDPTCDYPCSQRRGITGACRRCNCEPLEPERCPACQTTMTEGGQVCDRCQLSLDVG